MKNLSLTDKEHEVLTKLLEHQINDVKEQGSKDPFYTTDIVNIFRKLEMPSSVPLVAPQVIHGAPQEQEAIKPPMQPIPDDSMRLPKVVDRPIVTVKQPNADVTNIDTMADALLEPDNKDEVEVETPKVAK